MLPERLAHLSPHTHDNEGVYRGSTGGLQGVYWSLWGSTGDAQVGGLQGAPPVTSPHHTTSSVIYTIIIAKAATRSVTQVSHRRRPA
eukprot:386160-Prorocentrum_minimum.AAC.1